MPRGPERGALGTRGLALVGVALVGLLVLVAVASRTDTPLRSNAAERGDVPDYLGDYLGTFFLVFVLPVGIVLLIYAYAVRMRVRKSQQPGSAAKRLARTIVLVAAFSFVAVVVAERLADWRADRNDNGAGAGLVGERRGPGVGGGERAEFRWELAAVLYALLGAVVAAAVIAARRESQRRKGGPELAETLGDVLDETLDDLRAEHDPRRAVIAAYARMERALAAYGLPRRPFEAPLEYLSRILRELRVRAGAALDLTELFERAKFSAHEIEPAMKEEAIAALVAVRDDLRAPA
jgi:hypothetical protein